MFLKEYWFRELYLGLKVTVGVIHTNYRWTGQMHHTRLQAQRPAGSMERPVHHRVCPRMDDSSHIYHSLRRESIKNTNSASAIGVKSVRPTWFEDIVTTKQEQHEPMHGLKLVVKEEALPLREQREFPALAELAKRGLLAPDTWNCKRAQSA